MRFRATLPGLLFPAWAAAAAVPPPQAGARPGAPTNQTVAILILSGEEAGIPLSQLYGDARRVIEDNTPLNVAPLDVIALNQREAAIRDCAGKPECFAKKVRVSATSHVDWLLTVSIDRLEDSTLIGLRLVDVGSAEEIGAAGDEVPLGMSMIGTMERQLPSVFGETVWGQIATLEVKTSPEGAEVTVAGRSCVSPCVLTRLPPRTYAISLKKTGYDPWEGNVTLAARETVRVEETLSAPPDSIVTSPWLWSGVAIAAVGVGVALFFALRPVDTVVNICLTDNEARCR